MLQLSQKSSAASLSRAAWPVKWREIAVQLSASSFSSLSLLYSFNLSLSISFNNTLCFYWFAFYCPQLLSVHLPSTLFITAPLSFCLSSRHCSFYSLATRSGVQSSVLNSNLSPSLHCTLFVQSPLILSMIYSDFTFTGGAMLVGCFLKFPHTPILILSLLFFPERS